MCQMKRALSFLMAIFMVFSLLPLQVFAEDANNSLDSVASETLEKTIIDGVTIEYDAAGSLTWYEDYKLWDYYYDPNGSSVTTTLKVYNETDNSVLRFACEPYSCDSVIVDEEVVSEKKSFEVQPETSLVFQLSISKAAGLSFSDFALTEIVQSGVLFQYDNTLGSITVNGTAMVNGGRFEVPTSGATLNATANTGATFLGWVDGSTGQILSASANYLYKPTGQTSVKAAFAAPEATAWFYAGKNNGYLFDDLNTAATFAAKQDYKESSWSSGYDYRIMTLAASGTLAADTYNIPSGAKLLIPHSAADDGTFGTTPDYSETKYGAQTTFRTLKVEDGAVLNFNDSQLNVNGYVYQNNGSYTGVCTDAYGCIDLGTGAQINMNSGSKLYCYGYITGSGKVVANSDSTVYEVFQMNGWRGGTVTSEWQDTDSVKSFAFNDYAVQNIEATFVVNYGATAGVTATVSGEVLGSLQTKTIEATYIGKNVNGSGTGLLQLESGASVRRSFTPATNRMKYTFNGNAHIASINLSVDLGFLLGSFSLNTASYILAIPYYWDFVAESGTVTLTNDYKLLPGATLTVDTGAKAVIGKNSELYIYDTADYVGKGYASGNSIPVRYVASTGATAGSLPKMNSATASGQVTVNGELQIDGAMYVTENGGSSVDKVVKGGGVIVNNSTANAAISDVLDEFVYDSTNKKIVDKNINVIPVVGQIAGASVGEKYHSFAKDTYYGAGNGYWYQHVVSTSDFESIKDFKNIPAAAIAAVDRQRTLNHQGTKIENVLGFVSSYLNITDTGAETVTTPFTFTVNSLVAVTGDENSTLTGKGISTDPYVLTVTKGNTVLTSGEAVAGENEILMRFDDHLDMTGKTVEITDAGIPESYQVGYGIEENTVKDTAVVAMEGNYLVATGIGEAIVTIDGVAKTVKVSAAPISMLFLGGQSNMQGSRGEGKQSIVIPEGQSYLTYGERYSMTTSNATTYAPSSLTGEYRTINVEGSESGLSMFPVNTFEAQVATHDTYGKDGPDSGFALQWIESTGEKVWVINAAHGGSSISTWQDGGANYEEAVLLFKACMETMRKEIAAGHYTLSHMGYYWCQGCTDSGKSAEWYAPKFVAMYDAMKADLSMDMDSNPATPNQTLEFANIVLTVAGHMTTTGYRYEEGVYVAGDGSGFTTVEDLEMRGQRVAQLWLGANSEYPDINVVSNLIDSWITMPDGTDGVAEYFQKYYPNGVIDYTPQVAKSASWYKPTDANDVRASDSPIHYNQLGYNEMGREAVRNTMYLLGYAKDPADVKTEVTFYDWTGFREVTEIDAKTSAQSSTLVVPVVSPIYRSKDVSYKLSSGLSYNYYDLMADTTMTNGTLTAIGADGDTVKVKGRELSEFRWDLEGTNLVSTGNDENIASSVQGSIGTDGTYSNVTYSLEEAVVLKPDQSWLIEWKMTGPAADVSGYKKILAQYATRAEGDVSLMVHGNGQVVFGHYVGSHSQYGVTGLDLSGTHVYRLVNRVDEGGINMPYLYIDGVEVGPMNMVPSSEDTDNWAEGREIIFSSIGQTNYPISALNIEYIYVKESGATADMHIHSWGDWEVTIEPTLEAVGEETRTCDCGEKETREVPQLVKNIKYRWELDGANLKSVPTGSGYVENVLSKTAGSISAEGFVSSIQYALKTPIVLMHDQDWAVEWKMSGMTAGYQKLLATYATRTDGGDSIMVGSGRVVFGPYSSTNSHVQRGANELNDSSVLAGEHVYRLENVVNEDGSNMVYLYVDGQEIGPMDYNFKDSKTDTWINGKDMTFGYIGQTNYPMTDWNLYYISVELSGASEVEEEDNGINGTGIYRWDLQNDTLVSTGEERNKITRDQGTTEDDLFLKTRFSIEKPIQLNHDREWTVEWEMTGDWIAANDKLKKLFSEDGKMATSGAEAIMFSPTGRTISMGYYNGTTHLTVGVTVPETIDLSVYHKYQLVNRIDEATGGNMVYLLIDNAEIGTLNTPNKDGITKDWIVGNDFTFGFFGVNDVYFLDGGLINYIVVDEARGTEPEEKPEEPDVSGTWYRWELNEDKTELVPYTDRGYTENALTDKVGTISGGVTSGLQYKFTTPVVLDHTKPWTVEWDMTQGTNTSWQKILAGQAVALGGTENCLMVSSTSTLALSQCTTTHHNYTVGEFASSGILLTEQHKYRLENVCSEDGSNTIYLYVDDEQIGAMDDLAANKDAWIDKADLTFNYIGQQKNSNGNYYGLNGATINYIDIYLGDAPVEEPDEEPNDVFVNERYRWDFEDNALVSTGRETNAVTLKKGSVKDGFFNGVQYGLAKPVRLLPTEEWIVEWTMTLSENAGASYSKLMTLSQGRQNGDISISVNNANVALIYDNGGHTQYVANEFDKSVLTGEHTYRLQNVIEGDTNMVYLYVDNELVGPMDYALKTGTTNTFISGKPIVLGFFGQENYPMTNVIMDNIRVQERLVDCTHSWSEWVETLPTADGDGKKERTCSICSEAETVAVPGAWTVVSGFADRMQTYTGPKYKEVNLWEEMNIVSGYYSGSNWVGNYQSINFYIEGGEEIYATAFGKAPDNGHENANGIVITFFDLYGKPTKYSAAQVDEMFSENEYIKAPDDAIAVSVVQWKNEGSVVYIKNWPHGIHSYRDAEYIWSDDYSTCEAVRACECDGCEHSETAKATVTAETTPATCTVTGKTVYTAKFDVTWAEEQTYEKTLDVISHSYGDEWFTDETNHWHECSCGAKSEQAAHSDETTKDHMCDICGAELSKCEESEQTTSYARVEGTKTHTVTVTCKVCGQPVGETTTEDCADDDSDGKCDLCEGAISTDIDVVYGDVDGDTEITGNDALMIQRYVAKLNREINDATADVDGDGEVTGNDALLVQRYVAKLITSFPVDNP